MKRPIRPVSEYREHEDYPSVDEDLLSRRDFLRRVATTSALTAAGAVGVATTAGAAPAKKDKRERITIHLNQWQRIGKTYMRGEKLVIFTGDKKLARFLRDHTKARKLREAVKAQVGKLKADVLYDGKKLYKVERKLGALVVKHYRKSTRQRAAQPDVMLTVSRYYYRRRLGGVIAPPRRPYRPTP